MAVCKYVEALDWWQMVETVEVVEGAGRTEARGRKKRVVGGGGGSQGEEDD